MLEKLKKHQMVRVRTCQTVAGIMKTILLTKSPFDRDKEHMWTIGLSRRNMIKYIDLVSIGSMTGTIASPMEIYRMAVHKAANSIIICHNHPSGEVEPSENDRIITKQIREAGKILQIELMDSIIISENDAFYSFANAGSLW